MYGFKTANKILKNIPTRNQWVLASFVKSGLFLGIANAKGLSSSPDCQSHSTVTFDTEKYGHRVDTFDHFILADLLVHALFRPLLDTY